METEFFPLRGFCILNGYLTLFYKVFFPCAISYHLFYSYFFIVFIISTLPCFLYAPHPHIGEDNSFACMIVLVNINSQSWLDYLEVTIVLSQNFD